MNRYRVGNRGSHNRFAHARTFNGVSAIHGKGFFSSIKKFFGRVFRSPVGKKLIEVGKKGLVKLLPTIKDAVLSEASPLITKLQTSLDQARLPLNIKDIINKGTQQLTTALGSKPDSGFDRAPMTPSQGSGFALESASKPTAKKNKRVASTKGTILAASYLR